MSDLYLDRSAVRAALIAHDNAGLLAEIDSLPIHAPASRPKDKDGTLDVLSIVGDPGE